MKTWGVDPTIQEIRKKLRIRYKERVLTQSDFNMGYKGGILEALSIIRKAMKNAAMRKKKNTLRTIKRAVASYEQIRRFANKR
jgi:hypothetical protein